MIRSSFDPKGLKPGLFFAPIPVILLCIERRSNLSNIDRIRGKDTLGGIDRARSVGREDSKEIAGEIAGDSGGIFANRLAETEVFF